MSVCFVARSVSRPVWERVWDEPFTARVLAVFDRACNLITPDSHVAALVAPQIGDGPLNVVLDTKPDGFVSLEAGTLACLQEDRLRVGRLQVLLEEAEVWEPCPDWNSLRARLDAFTDRLPLLKSFSARNVPLGSLLPLVCEQAGGQADHLPAGALDSASAVLFSAAQGAMKALRVGWMGDAALIQTGAAQMAGLGSGLTPAGDDFLSGAMLWAWLAHLSPQWYCRILVEAAAPRTTTLSAALLRAAARGECRAAWHTLLAALSRGTDTEVVAAVRKVLSYGATSGADALAGFLWAASCTRP